MSIIFENAMTAIGLLGIGGLVGHYFPILWQRRSAAQSRKQEFEEIRFTGIIILMYSASDFHRQKNNLEQPGRQFNSRSELLEELQSELHVTAS